MIRQNKAPAGDSPDWARIRVEVMDHLQEKYRCHTFKAYDGTVIPDGATTLVVVHGEPLQDPLAPFPVGRMRILGMFWVRPARLCEICKRRHPWRPVKWTVQMPYRMWNPFDTTALDRLIRDARLAVVRGAREKGMTVSGWKAPRVSLPKTRASN